MLCILTLKSKANALKQSDIIWVLMTLNCLTLWHPATFRDFWKKKRLNAHGFPQEYLCSCTGYGPG